MKVKPPTEVVYQDAAKKSYENIPIGTLAERIQHVVQAAFGGKRIVIFSGGAAKSTEAVLEEIGEIAKGGGFYDLFYFRNLLITKESLNRIAEKWGE